MKIVFLADALDVQYAGIHLYCKNLLSAIDTLKTKHDIYVVSASKKQSFTNLYEISVPIKSYLPFHQRIRQFTTIPKLVNQLKPDVVVETAHFGPYKLNSTIKRVTFIHDLSPILYPQWHPVSSVWAHQLLLFNVIKNSNLLLTNSHFTKNEIKRHYPLATDKIKVTLLAGDTLTDERQSSSILNQLQIDKPYWLFVGTIEPRKNIITLLKAFEAFRQQNAKANTSLVLAGKIGWKQKKLRQYIEQSTCKKQIILTGYISKQEKVALYQNALALIYPSLYEGFGMPVIEAMTQGCPVICSNAASLPEVGGNAALYFPPNDIEALTEHLNLVFSNTNYKTEHQATLFQQAQQFGWQKTAEQTLEYLVNLC